jgi:PAS domain S-box-containing protein
MSDSASQLGYLCDPHISAQAIAAMPAWLWSLDGTHILWANAVGATLFGAETPGALASRQFDASDPVAEQIVRLSAILPTEGIPHLERLAGFGTDDKTKLACGCSRLTLPDGTRGILIVAAEPAGPGLALEERVQRLVADIDAPIAVFSAAGTLFHVNHAAAGLLAVAATLQALGADALATHALRAGYASGASTIGRLSLERIGNDAAVFLLARLPAAIRGSVTATAPVIASIPAEPAMAKADVFAPEPPAETDGPGAQAEEPAASAPPVSAIPERRQPLRFVWQMDADGHFTVESEDFIRLAGPRTAEALGQPWNEIAARLGIDPKGEVGQAVASRDTWSGITIDWPVDGTDERLAVELSGLPVFDRERRFGGYRGFGVCRNARQIWLAVSTRHQPSPSRPADERPVLSLVPQAENVVPFRAANNDKAPSLSPGERSAFHELAKELTSRLQQPKAAPEDPAVEQEREPAPEPELPAAALEEEQPAERKIVGFIPPRDMMEQARAAAAEPPKSVRAERGILDRLPNGVLIYRLDTPLYANSAFLEWSGYESLTALTTAGGLDMLFVEFDEKSVNAGDGQALRVSSNRGKQGQVDGRLFNVEWDDDGAHVLMLSPAGSAPAAAVSQPAPGPDPAALAAAENARAAADAERATAEAARVAAETARTAAQAARTEAEAARDSAEMEVRELRTLLDAANDGVLVLDDEGRILTANAGAASLFGRTADALTAASLGDLVAPESERAVLDYLAEMARNGASKKTAEVLGRDREGASLPLAMTLGRLGEANRLCAVFRDLSSWKKTEAELVIARRQAEKASATKSEFLAKISHEIRTPLNSIIGFSEVMMDERFGPIGNERYKQYLKDIHQSGAHLVSLLNDLLDLSKIEAGKLDLSFDRVSLNELTMQCVSLMQPQANQERVIIRTSLPPILPPVMADARSLRQIVLNLLSNSIKFTGAGGQVIVSAGQTDEGEVVLRVRDTGHGMTENEIQMAMEPFRQLATSSRLGSGGSGLGLPLTKALAEANRAHFSIKSAVNTGTLVEIAFPPTRVVAA